MQDIIEKYRSFDAVWHFTDMQNIPSIKKHGLLSFAEAVQRGVEIPVPGGNNWSHDADKIKGMDRYVHLAFIADHPMLYVAQNTEKRISNPVWLKINVSIILMKDVRFSAGVSNKQGEAILNAEEAKNAIDFDVLFTYMNWHAPEIQTRLQAAIKSEILVPDCIPAGQIIEYKNG